ncbi:MAG: DNA repair protein RecO [Gammaproteobacteria bacterium]|nr:MAG: DNA repair protein RecO [Gammaproteobacteria bacterium]
MNAVDGEPAWVLHARPWRDTSLLCELFSHGHGRVGVLARGVRGGRGGRRALLQPFRPLLVGWRGRGELPTLGAVEPAGAPLALAGEALYAGFYLNELLCRLLPRQMPQPPSLFLAYRESLGRLARGTVEPALRGFEKHLLEQLGYAYRFDRTADDDAPVRPGGRYRLEAGVGVLPCLPGEPGCSGEVFLALAREEWRPEWQGEHRRILQAALEPLLGGRPLRSRAVYGALRRLAGDRRRGRAG